MTKEEMRKRAKIDGGRFEAASHEEYLAEIALAEAAKKYIAAAKKTSDIYFELTGRKQIRKPLWEKIKFWQEHRTLE